MDTMSLFSMAGSAFSTIATAYFWLVRSRREQPNLRPHVADREFFLGNGGAETRQIGVKLGLIVANYSILPNSLLGVGLAVKKKDGSWQQLSRVSFDAATPLPFNIPPMQTVLLRLNGHLSFPAIAEPNGANQILTAYLEQLAQPRQFQVELRSLNNRRHVHVVEVG